MSLFWPAGSWVLYCLMLHLHDQYLPLQSCWYKVSVKCFNFKNKLFWQSYSFADLVELLLPKSPNKTVSEMTFLRILPKMEEFCDLCWSGNTN